MRKLSATGLIWLTVTIFVIVIDRYSKLWMLDHLALGEPVRVLPFLNLTLAYNAGAAFSFLNSASGWQHYFLGGLALVTAVFILVWMSRIPRSEKWQGIALSLILAGALGNVWDRVVYSHVIDFISFHLGDWYFAIFNIADASISIGAFMLILLWLRPSRAH